MPLRCCLVLLCVALFLDVPCEAYDSQLQGHSGRTSDGSVWTQLGWPALPNFRRSPNRRPYHSLRSQIYSQWPHPAADGTSDHYVRWPSARPTPAPSQHRVHQTQADQHRDALSQPEQSVTAHQPNHSVQRPHQTSNTVHRSHQPSHRVQRPHQTSRTVHRSHQPSHRVQRPHQTSRTVHRSHQPSHSVQRAQQLSRTVDEVTPRPEPSTREETRTAALAVHRHRTGRRPSQQWLLPRRFLVSTDSGRGRGPIHTCQDGKVWQNGRCECPYLSNWSEDTRKCECVYGTYRHSSGHCRSY